MRGWLKKRLCAYSYKNTFVLPSAIVQSKYFTTEVTCSVPVHFKCQISLLNFSFWCRTVTLRVKKKTKNAKIYSLKWRYFFSDILRWPRENKVITKYGSLWFSRTQLVWLVHLLLFFTINICCDIVYYVEKF